VIDLKLLRASPAQVRAALARRGDPSLIRLLDEIEALDMKRRTLTAQLDTLKAERNDAAKTDAQTAKAQGKLPDDVVAARRKLGGPDHEPRVGAPSDRDDARSESIVRPQSAARPMCEERRSCASWGTAGAQSGKPHWEIAERSASSICRAAPSSRGSGFPVLMGAGARLARGLINFMIDLHTRGPRLPEVEPPFLVRREVITGTGQLPKFEDDLYRTMPDDLFSRADPRKFR